MSRPIVMDNNSHAVDDSLIAVDGTVLIIVRGGPRRVKDDLTGEYRSVRYSEGVAPLQIRRGHRL